MVTVKVWPWEYTLWGSDGTTGWRKPVSRIAGRVPGFLHSPLLVKTKTYKHFNTYEKMCLKDI